MGINTAWKGIIRAEFEWPEATPQDLSQVDVVVDDITLNVRRIVVGIESWPDLFARVQARITMVASTGRLREYRLMWDQKGGPPNKAVIQSSRAKACPDVPFSDLEQSMITIGQGAIPAPQETFFKRLMATRIMHKDLYMFMASAAAQTPLPQGVTIVLDGVRAMELLQSKMSGAVIEFAGVSTPTSVDEMSEVERAQFEAIGKMYVTASPSGAGNTVVLRESSGIGESDLKVPEAIREQPPGSKIFLRICDGDMFPILLLHMRNYINMDDSEPNGVPYGTIKYQIYIDTNGPGRKNGQMDPILDMTQLWRNITMTFRARYVRCDFPAETLSTLMLLSGSDYVDGFPMIGPGGIWKAFTESAGRNTLFPPDRPSEPGVIVDDTIGQPEARIYFGLAETHWYYFISYIYHKMVLKTMPFPHAGRGYSLEKVRETRRREVAMWRAKNPSKKETVRNSWTPPEDDMIIAIARRLHWNLDYFANGDKDIPFLDPFALQEDTFESIHGWVNHDTFGPMTAPSVMSTSTG